MKTCYKATYLFLLVLSALPSYAKNEANQISNKTVSTLFPLRVVQQKIGDCDFQSGKPVADQRVLMSATAGGDVTVSGKDRSNRVWTSTYEATPGAGCQLWKVDLGRNGRLDLAFVEFGANSSGGWDTTLSLLLFDNDGLPFPWQATSLFTVDDLGIRELVKLGEEKRQAVIVPQRLGEVNGKGIEFHAYDFTDNRVQEVLGSYANKAWPFTVPPGILTSPSSQNMGSLSTIVPAISQVSQTKTGTHDFLRLKGDNDAERQVVFSDQSMDLPKILIVDSAAGRKIISSPQPSDFQNLKTPNVTTTVLGQDCTQGTCFPLIMWMK